ncbi:hypothetical protein TK06_09865 [Pseudomonas fluorescens]|uniref:Uncharacterized protein n=1 Tax=Pseudomonas fluorescens TaxID=294 RepID=A0A159ZUR5_PSEFL|nr:hypothetical protein TK06_09865 [Pseudomonas fluorescens]
MLGVTSVQMPYFWLSAECLQAPIYDFLLRVDVFGLQSIGGIIGAVLTGVSGAVCWKGDHGPC